MDSQVLPGFDQDAFPYLIGRNYDYSQLNLVNTKTGKQITLVEIKQCHKYDCITWFRV